MTVWNEELFIRDMRFPENDPRRQVCRAHRHLMEDGTPGGSGLWDPKEILIEDVNYRKFQTSGGRLPHCELCEHGDMIPPSERFYASTYRPE
jgi:hypothetical protein